MPILKSGSNFINTMYCKNCGNQLNSIARFCNKCGTPVDTRVSKVESSQDTLVDTEFKKAIYKLENEEIEEAQRIFEDLAFAHNAPTAWIYLGGIKLGQLDTGETTVQQALNCFNKALEINPILKEDYQETYYELSIQQIEKFRNYYLNTKKQASKANRKAFGGLAFSGLSLLLGSQSKTTTNKILGDAGAVYGGYRANKNFQNNKDVKQLLPFYEMTIKQLAQGIKSYCSDNKNIYQNFLTKMSQFKLPQPI